MSGTVLFRPRLGSFSTDQLSRGIKRRLLAEAEAVTRRYASTTVGGVVAGGCDGDRWRVADGHEGGRWRGELGEIDEV